MSEHGPQQMDRIGDKREAARWVIGLVPMIVVCGALLAAGSFTKGVEARREAGAVSPAKAMAATPALSVVPPPVMPARVRRHAVKIAYPPQTVVVTGRNILVRSDMHDPGDQTVDVIMCYYPAKLPPPRTICEPEAPGESGIALAWTRNPRQQHEPEEDCAPERREDLVAQGGEAAAGPLTGP